LLLPGILLLALPFYRPAEIPFFLLFVGRLHPILLHFPIVLIILLLLFEVVRVFKWINIPNTVVLIVLITAAASTLVSVGAGFFLFASGDYSGNLLEQHLWAGVITGFLIFTTSAIFISYLITRRRYMLYWIALVASNVSVAVASHLGGSITHGQDYLTEHLQLILDTSETHEVKLESEMLVYEDILEPIFEAKCVSCHNSLRAKGNLLMTSYENILKAGESDNPSITPGLPEKSEVYKRVVLPLDHDDHMPPEGKTPMTEDEISVLKHWISSGAKPETKVQKAKEDPAVKTVIENLLPELSRYRRNARIESIKRKELENELVVIASTLGIVIQQDSSSEESFFAIAMSFPPAPFTNEQFKILNPYMEIFSKASLVASGIDDAGLYYVGQMVNLEKLFLQKTDIDGSGLVYLQDLPKLRVLNLSFTKVDDKAALDLLRFPHLEEVYLYRTNTTKEVIDAIQKNKPELKIYLQEGPYF
jgi:uncharacterized membrane protein